MAIRGVIASESCGMHYGLSSVCVWGRRKLVALVSSCAQPDDQRQYMAIAVHGQQELP
jgi:hypothetical protein